jgi:uncharacterized YccA/Bax inhibitor family protein
MQGSAEPPAVILLTRIFEHQNSRPMAFFKSGNPTLSQKIFDRSASMEASLQGTMSVRGTINKFGFLLLMIVAGAAYNWHLFAENNRNQMSTLMIVGFIGGFIAALIISFKPTTARYLAPLYGLLEGLALGGISAILNESFAKSYPGLIMQAVLLTFGVAFAMFFLYNFRIIKATERFKSIMLTAMVGIMIFFALTWILRLFGVNMSFLYDNSMLSIGISLFLVGIAALNLILDFDMIEKGAESGAPKYMEWYGAFGLMVTLVWLYLEILRLLSKTSSSK